MAGTFYRHVAPSGVTCTGSGNPLHAPGQGSRTVATYVLLHDEAGDSIVLAHMSPRRDRLRLLLTVGSVGTDAIVQLSLPPGHVRQLADELGAWVRAGREILGPLEATALASGTTATAPDVTWRRALPVVRMIPLSRGELIKTQTGGTTTPELVICAVRDVRVRTAGLATLDLDQVGRLRDGLESWLDWVGVLYRTGLHPTQSPHHPEGAC